MDAVSLDCFESGTSKMLSKHNDVTLSDVESFQPERCIKEVYFLETSVIVWPSWYWLALSGSRLNRAECVWVLANVSTSLAQPPMLIVSLAQRWWCRALACFHWALSCLFILFHQYLYALSLPMSPCSLLRMELVFPHTFWHLVLSTSSIVFFFYPRSIPF